MGESMRKLKGLFGGRKPVDKTGILLAMPSLEGFNRTEQVMLGAVSGAVSVRHDMPYLVEPYGLLNRYPVSDARNECTQHFMEQTQHEYLAFWDHDMVPPSNWYDLIGKGDIVSGVTFMWDAARKPHQRLQMNQFLISERNVSETLIPALRTEPYEVDIVGTACMVIHRRVFEKLGPRPFKEPVGPDGKRAMGEDMAFCREARSHGFKVTIIPTVIFEHVKTVGLVAVWESFTEISQLSYKAGYIAGMKKATQAQADACDPIPLPTMSEQIEGGAA